MLMVYGVTFETIRESGRRYRLFKTGMYGEGNILIEAPVAVKGEYVAPLKWVVLAEACTSLAEYNSHVDVEVMRRTGEFRRFDPNESQEMSLGHLVRELSTGGNLILAKMTRLCREQRGDRQYFSVTDNNASGFSQNKRLIWQFFKFHDLQDLVNLGIISEKASRYVLDQFKEKWEL